MAISNPLNFEEEILIKNIGEILEEKSEIILKLLMVFAVQREDLFKKYPY